MTFRTAFALLATLVIALPSPAEDKLPPAVKPILEKAVREVRKNRQEFDKANEKPLADARRALEELSTKLIKDGKAEDATIVLKQMGSLEADVMKMANAPSPAPVAGGTGPKAIAPSPTGKWSYPYPGTGQPSPWMQLHPDGTTTSSWHGEKGLWARGEDGLLRVFVTKSRSINVFEISKDGNVLRDSEGKIAQRIP